MQPRFVIEGVVADFMSGGGDGCQCFEVFFAGGVLTDDEHRHLQLAFVQYFQKPRHDKIQVRGILVPTGVAMSLHVRPFVVEVERQAGDGFGHELKRIADVVVSESVVYWCSVVRRLQFWHAIVAEAQTAVDSEAT